MLGLLKHHYQTLFLLIIAFAFFTRIWQIHVPETYVFDEVYHAATAKLIAKNDPRAFEWWNPAPEKDAAVDWLHPPLAKYTQAIGIRLFGENSFGWRISSAIFGVGVIALVMILTKRVTNSSSASLVAGLLASFDGLLLVQSRIAMNDIHVTFFILLSIILYLNYKSAKSVQSLLLLSLSVGAAIGTKWSGIFILGWVIFIESLSFLGQIMALKKAKKVYKRILEWLGFIASVIGISILVYVASYTQMFLQGKTMDHFIKLHEQIWSYQTTLKATHPYQSRPQEWFLDIRPTWYYVQYVDDNHRADIYAFGNPFIQWFGVFCLTAILIISLFSLSSLRVKRFSKKIFSKSLLKLVENPFFLIVSAYAIVWTPWFLSPRIMFYYHYTPAVPLLAIFITLTLQRAWKFNSEVLKGMVGAVLIVSFIVFLLWYPHWTGIETNMQLKDYVYFAFNSWK